MKVITMVVGPRGKVTMMSGTKVNIGTEIMDKIAEGNTKALRRALINIKKEGARMFGRVAVRNLRWVINNQSFYGFPPMRFSGALANSLQTKPNGRYGVDITGFEYALTLVEGLPAGTQIKVTDYVHAWARKKMGGKSGYALQKVIKKKGTKPRNWIEIAEFRTATEGFNKFDELIEGIIEKELSKIKL